MQADKDAYLMAEEAKISATRERLSRCDALTTNMMDILSGLEDKLTALEKTMVPIQKQTLSLTTAKKNITLTRAETDRVQQHVRVAMEDEEEINMRQITSDYRGYLDWVHTIAEATDFFTQNAEFKDSDRYMRRLRDLNKKAMHECETEFARLVEQHNKPVDLERTGWPLPASFEIIPAAMVNRLSRIAACFEASGNDCYKSILKEQRGALLKQSHKNVIHEAFLPQSMRVQAQEALQEGRYRRGAHKLMFHLEYFLRLLELEHAVLGEILGATNCSEQDLANLFCSLCVVPVEYFVKKAEQVVKEKAPNKVLVMFDMLSSLNTLLPRFEVVLSNQEDGSHCFSMLLEFRATVMVQTKRAVMEYRQHIFSDHDVSKRAKRAKDGTIHPLTIQTFNFLKQLNAFRSTIEALPESAFDLQRGKERNDSSSRGSGSDAGFAGMGSRDDSGGGGERRNSASVLGKQHTMGTLTELILDALEQTLTKQAKGYKNAALSAVFLLNNYHYIAKTSKQERFQLEPHFFERYAALIISVRKDYRIATWKKVLGFLDTEDNKALLEKNLPAMTKSGRKAIKARFAGFNAAFEENYTTQRLFSVPESDLRSQLRNDNVELIVARYYAFLQLYRNVDFTSNPPKYIKYTVAQVESMINEYFDEEA